MLDIYLQDKQAGYLEQTASGQLEFSYDTDYLKEASYGISLSMLLSAQIYKGAQVTAVFSGLLPEESVRDRLAKHLALSEKNQFALLEAVGGDCAGALALYPHGVKPPKAFDDVEVLDDIRLRDVLELIKRRSMLAGDDGYRFSLARAQDKLAVRFKDGKLLLIKGGAPTTHILKPMIEWVKDSAHNELFCMRLAKMVGLDVPEASLHFVGDTPYYLVDR
jgi:serine/threonine-protein kinase HipA